MSLISISIAVVNDHNVISKYLALIKTHGRLISDYLDSFKLVLVELIKCNISDEAKSKIKEIKAKLFKYES